MDQYNPYPGSVPNYDSSGNEPSTSSKKIWLIVFFVVILLAGGIIVFLSFDEWGSDTSGDNSLNNSLNANYSDDIDNSDNETEEEDEENDNNETDLNLSTCDELEGDFCDSDELCNGTFMDSSEGEFCCSGNCYVNETNSTCNESWSCDFWGPCESSTQIRNCTDLNSCGTIEDKPVISQSCTNPLDCGYNYQSIETYNESQPNYDCFIQASETCTSAKLVNTVVVELFGIVSNSTSHMELIVSNNTDTCIFYLEYLSVSAEFSEEIVEEWLANGTTQEEIDLANEELNTNAQSSVGWITSCEFGRLDLTATLTRWKSGQFSTSDYDDATCLFLTP